MTNPMKMTPEAVRLGAKLFEDFNRAFSSMSKIEEIGTIFSEKQLNTSPIHVAGDCLGVEKWCIKHLYLYAYQQLMSTSLPRKYLEKVDELSRCVVIFCADCTTAWNIRKQTLLTSSDALVQDLQISRLALRLHPKSTEAMAHRRWIFKNLFPSLKYSKTLDCETLCSNDDELISSSKCLPCDEKRQWHDYSDEQWQLLLQETKLCEKAAEWHKCNYSAWSHRLWITKTFMISPMPCFRSKRCIMTFANYIFKELVVVMNWIELNVSDHSGMAFCQQILCHLTNLCVPQNKELSTLIQTDILLHWSKALQQCNQLLTLYNGQHEALWMHQYELVLCFHKLFTTGTAKFDDSDKQYRNTVESFSWKKCLAFCESFVQKDSKNSYAANHHLTFLNNVLSSIGSSMNIF